MEHRTVILAAGDFPRKGGAAERLLASATRVIACDSAAAAYRRRFRRWPDIVVGDMDSLRAHCVPCRVIHDADQDTNDLEKAMTYCASNGWRNPVIVGAAGRREDHTLGNVFRALDYGCEIVTDYGRFVPLCGSASFRVKKGDPVSVFATDSKTRMTSKGLEWPLDGVRFANLYCATLNRATGERVTLTSDRPVYVYFAERN